MKTNVSFYDFQREFEQCRPDNFSRQGLGVLWDYLEQYEEDCGEELELDVIALCCDFSEASVEQIADGYSIDLSECGGDYYEISEAVRKHLEDNGALIGEVSGGFVYRDFKGLTMTFSQLPIGALFQCNGNQCRKQSTRTAVLTQYGRVFYFSQTDRVTPCK